MFYLPIHPSSIDIVPTCHAYSKLPAPDSVCMVLLLCNSDPLKGMNNTSGQLEFVSLKKLSIKHNHHQAQTHSYHAGKLSFHTSHTTPKTDTNHWNIQSTASSSHPYPNLYIQITIKSHLTLLTLWKYLLMIHTCLQSDQFGTYCISLIHSILPLYLAQPIVYDTTHALF